MIYYLTDAGDGVNAQQYPPYAKSEKSSPGMLDTVPESEVDLPPADIRLSAKDSKKSKGCDSGVQHAVSPPASEHPTETASISSQKAVARSHLSKANLGHEDRVQRPDSTARARDKGIKRMTEAERLLTPWAGDR